MSLPLSPVTLLLLVSIALATAPAQLDVHIFSPKSLPSIRAPKAERTLQLSSILSQGSAHVLFEASFPALLRQTSPERLEQIRVLRRRLRKLTSQLPVLRELLRTAQAKLFRAQDELVSARKLLRVSLICNSDLKKFIRKCPSRGFANRNPDVCDVVKKYMALAREVCRSEYDATGLVAEAEKKKAEAKGLVEKRTNALDNLNFQVQDVTERLERVLRGVMPQPSNDPPKMRP